MCFDSYMSSWMDVYYTYMSLCWIRRWVRELVYMWSGMDNVISFDCALIRTWVREWMYMWNDLFVVRCRLKTTHTWVFAWFVDEFVNWFICGMDNVIRRSVSERVADWSENPCPNESRTSCMYSHELQDTATSLSALGKLILAENKFLLGLYSCKGNVNRQILETRIAYQHPFQIRQVLQAKDQMERALQCVAVCCSVLQCVAVCCSVLQCVAVCCSVLHRVAACCKRRIGLNARVIFDSSRQLI